ncbi:MAG: YkgJ family cysteine cluster protein [Bacteroidota bacterium]
MRKTKIYFEEYLSIRSLVDSISNQLEEHHSKHMHCKAGCDLCCMDYNIFPVEFYAILNSLKEKDIKPETLISTTDEQCIFLNNHRCAIYRDRPIICRTHGLPLLFMNDNGEWELSACELNFTEFDFAQFSQENTFPQDKFNSKLFTLNKRFIHDFEVGEHGEFDLISLKRLMNYL